MNRTPLVTVGLSFYNNRSTIGTAIASVLDQRFEDFELVVVDDGSTDGGDEVVRRFRDSRIRFVRDAANHGFVARLNQLTELASGDYLARMDGDDICHPDRLARQVEHLERHPQVDVVATGAWVVDESDRVVGSRHQRPLATSAAAVLGHGYLLQPSVLARRAFSHRA